MFNIRLAEWGKAVVRIFKRVTSIGYRKFPPANVNVVDDESEKQIYAARDAAKTVRNRLERLENNMKRVVEDRNRRNYSSD